MRIISQNGTLDLPYESISITIGHKCDSKEFYIFAHLVNSAEPKKDPQKLGTYSTEAKAQKAMEMLHEEYNDYIVATNLISHEILLAYAEKYSEEKFHKIAYPYFQFPADEDVEV